MKCAVLLITLSFLVGSCIKEKAVCTGNCYPLKVTGKVINRLTNTPAANVPITVDWVKFLGVLSQSKSITTFKSGNDGLFNITANIDTALFRDQYFLALRPTTNNDYIILRDKEDYRIYDLSQDSFNNLELSVYPKTSLKIKLNRKQNDNFQYLTISYSFAENSYFFPLTISSSKDVHSRELNVPTSADLFTKIIVTKMDMNGVSTASVDSIKCVKNSSNVLSFDF